MTTTTSDEAMGDRMDQDLEDELFTIEEGFWIGDQAFFRQHLDDHCLIAFPQMGEMHGLKTREEVASTASTQPGRWKDLKMSNRHLARLADGAAIISYRANVKRFDDEPYPALVSSAYVRRADGWKLAFHQHSPVG